MIHEHTKLYKKDYMKKLYLKNNEINIAHYQNSLIMVYGSWKNLHQNIHWKLGKLVWNKVKNFLNP